MADKIREAAADALDAFGDVGRWLLAAALVGAAGVILIRTIMGS